jgi:ribosomal protein S27E
MPNYGYCQACKDYSIIFDPKGGVATCSNCGEKFDPAKKKD